MVYLVDWFEGGLVTDPDAEMTSTSNSAVVIPGEASESDDDIPFTSSSSSNHGRVS
jgi:hypothetical protein